MEVLNAGNSACVILTEKEGALSVVAHNLAIKVTDFSVEFDEASGSVEGSFEANSLSVIGALDRSGSVDKSVLSSKNRAEIEENIRKDVLKVGKYPQVLVKGVYADESFDGEVTICGQTRSVCIGLVQSEGMWSFETEFDQRDFGVKPYSAMMGMLKVAPVLKVSFSFEPVL